MNSYVQFLAAFAFLAVSLVLFRRSTWTCLIAAAMKLSYTRACCLNRSVGECCEIRSVRRGVTPD